jgi:hypothetical protein
VRRLKLPSDAEVDKVISFVEKIWRRLIEMGRNVIEVGILAKSVR